jgi:hypothetical protein
LTSVPSSRIAADRALDDEEAVAVEREVGRLARGHQRALGEDLLRPRHAHARADLAPGAERAAEHVFEERARLLETDGVRVGDVVAHHAEGLALRVQPRRARIHRLENGHPVSVFLYEPRTKRNFIAARRAFRGSTAPLAPRPR